MLFILTLGAQTNLGCDTPITFVADEDVINSWDGTLICFGSSDSNIKTLDVESLPQNGLYQMATDPSTGWRYFRVAGRDFRIDPNEDKAVILRIRNPRAQKYWLFICAGLGEWGTSGAARYLFTRWQELHKRFNDRNFVLAIGVRIGSDESSEELYSASS